VWQQCERFSMKVRKYTKTTTTEITTAEIATAEIATAEITTAEITTTVRITAGPSGPAMPLDIPL